MRNMYFSPRRPPVATSKVSVRPRFQSRQATGVSRSYSARTWSRSASTLGTEWVTGKGDAAVRRAAEHQVVDGRAGPPYTSTTPVLRHVGEDEANRGAGRAVRFLA